jgi:mono/diheme cytochrome c family protein
MLRAMPQLRALRLRLITSTPLLLLLALAACDGGDDDHDHGDAADEADTEALDGDLVKGQAIHDDTCMVPACHGGGNGVDLAEHIPEHTNAELREVIESGTELMPAQTQLSEQDVTDVMTYLRSIY